MNLQEFNERVAQISPTVSEAARGELKAFQDSGLFPHEFNINSFTGAIESDALYDEVHGSLMKAAGISPTFTPTN
jgi:hypothetical protein